jgi:hypothetical protein
MSKRKDPASYEIGYRKPPKATRFNKGQSGNPKGRRKGAPPPSSTELWQQSLNSAVLVKQDGKCVRMSRLEVIISTTTTKAMKGDSRAIAQVLKVLETLDPPHEERGQCGVLVVPGRMSPTEWAERFGYATPDAEPIPSLRPSDPA